MTIFAYHARTSSGALEESSIEAANRDEAIEMLMRQGYTPIDVSVKQTGLKGDIKLPFLERKPSKMEVALFTRQFAKMREQDIPLRRSLVTLERQVTNKMFKGIIQNISLDIEAGDSLTEAFSKYPNIFSPIYLGLLATGETSGNMPESLSYLADILMREVALERKIRSALTYPITVLIAALGITYFLLTSIVPQFASMLKDAGGELPTLTKAVIAVSSFFQNYPLIILGVIIAVILGLRAYNSTPEGHYQLDTLKLKLPVFGPLIRKSSIAKVTRAMGMMLRSGMSFNPILELSQAVAGNAVIAKALANVNQSVLFGNDIGESFEQEENVFPPIMTSMIATGSETGALDDMLIEVAEYYDLEVEELTSSLASLIEPIMTIILGLLVGTIVAAMLLPYFSIIGQLSNKT